MTHNNRRATVVIFSVFIGVLIGLVLASNLSLTRSTFAEIESNSSNSALTTANNSIGLAPVNSDLEATSRAFVEIAKRVTPTVVSITSEKLVKRRDPFSNFFNNDDFFRRFFRQPDGDNEQEFRRSGLGSGVIVSSDGYIITNYHVVKDADAVNVVLDKKELEAEIVGTDPATDIAVLRIDRDGLPAIAFGNSDQLEVGEWVLAIGNPFDISLEQTVTSGIISAKGRSRLSLGRDLTYQDFIQTDAAINPGNSGGALVNIRGELIGINTAIYSGNTGGNVGIGFAIPINLAKRVMDDLITKGRVVRGYLGVTVGTPDADLSEALNLEDGKGAVVNDVIKDTPADRAGLREYDVVIELDGKPIEDSQMLTNMIGAYDPGDTVELKVKRDGVVKRMTVRLAERPSNDNEVIARSSAGVVGRLGIGVVDLTDQTRRRFGYEDTEGVLVSRVAGNSIAFEKGLRQGDLIVEVDRQRVGSARELERTVDELGTGEIVLFQVRRQQDTRFIAMKIPR